MNQDILEVDALGIDFIQLDEFTWPYFYEDWAIEAFNVAVQGVKNAKIIVHVCWGNWGGTPAYYPDEPPRRVRSSTSPSASPMLGTLSHPFGRAEILRRSIDVLNLESCGRRDDDLSGLEAFKEFPLPEKLVFWAGVIDVKSTITETAEQVAARIRKLLRGSRSNGWGSRPTAGSSCCSATSPRTNSTPWSRAQIVRDGGHAAP